MKKIISLQISCDEYLFLRRESKLSKRSVSKYIRDVLFNRGDEE